MGKQISKHAEEMVERMLQHVNMNTMTIFDTSHEVFTHSAGYERRYIHRAVVKSSSGKILYTLQDGSMSGTKIGKRNQARLEKAYIEAGRVEYKQLDI